MTIASLPQIEQNIARCRLVLSLSAIAAIYVDPTEPLLSRWISLRSGAFVMDRRLLIVVAAHLAYSSIVLVGLTRRWFSPHRVVVQTMWCDVLFGIAIAALTEGTTSPFYPFFAFAVLVVGLRAGLRPALLVTLVGVGLYVGLILLETGASADVYIMRPVYLAITGYLVGYLGQQRLQLEDQVRALDAAEQRHRIGRELHDGFIQSLAGFNLRIESCRRWLRGNAVAEALTDLTELQDSVNREYDELRAYMRSLAGRVVTPPSRHECATDTRLSVNADLSGSIELVDHVLQIAREGIANIRRHAGAKAGKIQICTAQSEVRIHIEDDGVGFGDGASPWSIASRVAEIGGRLQVLQQQGQGAHLSITLPQG